MPKFYYIARRKYRGEPNARYVGDGLIDAKSKTDAKRVVAQQRGTPRNLVEVRLRAQDNEPTCPKCGQYHSPTAIKLAEVFMGGHEFIQTTYGRKSACGVASTIDSEFPNSKYD